MTPANSAAHGVGRRPVIGRRRPRRPRPRAAKRTTRPPRSIGWCIAGPGPPIECFIRQRFAYAGTVGRRIGAWSAPAALSRNRIRLHWARPGADKMDIRRLTRYLHQRTWSAAGSASPIADRPMAAFVYEFQRGRSCGPAPTVPVTQHWPCSGRASTAASQELGSRRQTAPILFPRLAINLVRVAASEPADQLGMALVRRVGHRFQIVGISPRATDIFRRTSTFRVDKARILLPQLGRETSLDLDRVLPVVAEVIVVAQQLELRHGQDARERGLS